MLTVEFIDEHELVETAHLPQIEQLLQFAATYEGITEEAEVAVSFVTDEEIKEINRDYRDKDSITDVISFALEDGDDELFDIADVRTLGDIIICTNRAKTQAKDYGHTYERELGFLSLHGFLHLLGYDHMNEQDEKTMFTKQDEILNQFGLTRD